MGLFWIFVIGPPAPPWGGPKTTPNVGSVPPTFEHFLIELECWNFRCELRPLFCMNIWIFEIGSLLGAPRGPIKKKKGKSSYRTVVSCHTKNFIIPAQLESVQKSGTFGGVLGPPRGGGRPISKNWKSPNFCFGQIFGYRHLGDPKFIVISSLTESKNWFNLGVPQMSKTEDLTITIIYTGACNGHFWHRVDAAFSCKPLLQFDASKFDSTNFRLWLMKTYIYD